MTNTAGDVTANLPVTLPPFQVPAPGPATGQEVVIKGSGFGATTGQVTLTPATGTSNAVASPTSWTDTEIHVLVGTASGVAPTPGAYQLGVRNTGSKKDAVNGLTFHILGTGYNPTLIQVNPPAAYAGNSTAANTFRPKPADTDLLANPETAIQDALDRAAVSSVNTSANGALVVVWPGVVTTWSPTGDYFENLIVHSNVKIQGVGPGGFQGQTYVPGTRINGLGFQPDNPQGANWIATLQGLGVDPETVPDGAVVTVLGDTTFDRSYKAAIDGATITGGAQQGFGTNVNVVSGGNRTPVGGAGALVTQGGGVFLHTQADGMQISNNLLVGNSGTYGGAIRIGTPYTAVQATNGSWSVPNTVKNTGVRILHNRMRDNGGTNLAGGVGIFDGSDNYVVDHNDLCGNFSAEYGGGLSHYGLSDGGKITFNRIYLNGSYDEGGGVMVAGELNPNVNQPSAGAAHSNSSLTIDAQHGRAEPRQRRRRRHPVPPGRHRADLGDEQLRQRQHQHPRGRRLRARRLDERVDHRQHGDAQHHHRDRRHERRQAGSGGPVRRGQQRPAAGHPAGGYHHEPDAALQQADPEVEPVRRQPRRDVERRHPEGHRHHGGGRQPRGTPGPSSRCRARRARPRRRRCRSAGPPRTGRRTPTRPRQLSPAPSAADTATPAVVKAYDVSVVIEANRAFPNFRQAVMVANVVAPDVTGDYHLTAANGHGGTAERLPGGPRLPEHHRNQARHRQRRPSGHSQRADRLRRGPGRLAHRRGRARPRTGPAPPPPPPQFELHQEDK